MLVGVWQSIFILLTFIAFYAVDVWLMRRYDPLRAEGSSRAWDYTILMLLAAAFLILQPALLPGLGLQVEAAWGLVIQVLGALLILAALALHVWARTHLAQFYGEREEVQDGQYLVTTGPYAHVRHPIYTSYFVGTIGLLLINPAIPTLLAVVYSFVDFSLATRREEKLLQVELQGYADYMARTPRFLPWFHG
jgi:protein-S-isoprenylcysteine O-methyltransferase Ste14